MKFIKVFLGIFMAIFSIAMSVIMVLNLKIIYRLAIPKFNLVEKSGLSLEKLMDNYNSMISYLRNPFIDKLTFDDFYMSKTGEIHFEEVKGIFMWCYLIILCFILVCIFIKGIEKISKQIKFSLIANYCSNTIIALFIVTIVAILVDFSKTFEIFHKIFFRNDYWQFNPLTDPIINILPEGIFMVYALVIITFLILQAVIYKLIYYKYKRKIS